MKVFIQNFISGSLKSLLLELRSKCVLDVSHISLNPSIIRLIYRETDN